MELARIQMPRFEDPSDLDRNQQCSERAPRTCIRSSQASQLIGSEGDRRHSSYAPKPQFFEEHMFALCCIMVAKVRY